MDNREREDDYQRRIRKIDKRLADARRIILEVERKLEDIDIRSRWLIRVCIAGVIFGAISIVAMILDILL